MQTSQARRIATLTRQLYIRQPFLRLLPMSLIPTRSLFPGPTVINASTIHSYQTFRSSVCLQMLTSNSAPSWKYKGFCIILAESSVLISEDLFHDSHSCRTYLKREVHWKPTDHIFALFINCVRSRAQLDSCPIFTSI